ncbi:PREDICTED: uncharacterized protein LOC109238018 [Nicotiana attenuata]|uniref:uncharacterized protein LOC109238018 n=1 Tax=Nicotiana attenuata TaxID=49451 RepID=UPI000905C1E2|nr:PREDICTED: uncharacterized protein LOC109238018 [Nicotiana attenuata]
MRILEDNCVSDNSYENRSALSRCRAEFTRYFNIQESIMRQIARDKWFKECDANTTYFHSVIKARRRRLTITMKMDDQNQWLEGNDVIAEAAVRHFQGMFTQESHNTNFNVLNCIERCITDNDNNMLKSIPTIHEIKEAMFIMDKDSAPGPDGLSGYFYQFSWDITCNDLNKAVESFFQGAKHPMFFTHTCLEIIKDIKKPSRGGNVVIKLDMAKAYDRVSWEFLCMALKNIGFYEWWIHLIHNYISNNWYSVIVNGGRHGFFKSNMGLRQGDPISPSLFFISAELLSKMLNNLHDRQGYKGFYMSVNGPKINHLSFANDTILFCNGGKDTLEIILKTLEIYEKISG